MDENSYILQILNILNSNSNEQYAPLWLQLKKATLLDFTSTSSQGRQFNSVTFVLKQAREIKLASTEIYLTYWFIHWNT